MGALTKAVLLDIFKITHLPLYPLINTFITFSAHSYMVNIFFWLLQLNCQFKF